VSYFTISRCAQDSAFQQRLSACLASEGHDQPGTVMAEYVWEVSARSDIEAAYASALSANNENPGGDEAVITDQMILSAVQAHTQEPTP
jgi:hypothetical protein